MKLFRFRIEYYILLEEGKKERFHKNCLVTAPNAEEATTKLKTNLLDKPGADIEIISMPVDAEEIPFTDCSTSLWTFIN